MEKIIRNIRVVAGTIFYDEANLLTTREKHIQVSQSRLDKLQKRKNELLGVWCKNNVPAAISEKAEKEWHDLCAEMKLIEESLF